MQNLKIWYINLSQVLNSVIFCIIKCNKFLLTGYWGQFNRDHFVIRYHLFEMKFNPSTILQEILSILKINFLTNQYLFIGSIKFHSNLLNHFSSFLNKNTESLIKKFIPKKINSKCIYSVTLKTLLHGAQKRV